MTEAKLAALINRICFHPPGKITLDGKRALICGFLNDRPTVETMSQPRISARFTWEQIKRVLDSGGAFTTGGQSG